jgi:hypothetical protein
VRSVASLAGGYARGLGELWKFEPSTGLWTWVGGSNVADAEGIFGSERGHRHGQHGVVRRVGVQAVEHIEVSAGRVNRHPTRLTHDRSASSDGSQRATVWIDGQMAPCACGAAVTVPVTRNVRVPAVQFGYQRNQSSAQSIWARTQHATGCLRGSRVPVPSGPVAPSIVYDS